MTGEKLVIQSSCFTERKNIHLQFLPDEVAGLQCMKRILGKVQEMKGQRSSLEKQLRELIQQDDITAALVTTERADMKVQD